MQEHIHVQVLVNKRIIVEFNFYYIFSSNDHNVEECRDLKEALLSSFDLIKLYDPKTYCHVIREFLNQLPISLFPICHSEYQFRWLELTQSCRNMITRRSHNKYDKFDRLIAEYV